ncbi:MAG: hypothetical protein AAB839_02390 [Patescibacteria group bacterium]
MISLLLSLALPAAHAADADNVALAIQIVQTKGTVLPTETATTTMGSGDTTITVQTVLHSWGYRSFACQNYPAGVGVFYQTALTGGLQTLSVDIKTPNTNPGAKPGEMVDLMFMDVGADGVVDQKRTTRDPEARNTTMANAQATYDYVLGCLAAGG